MSGAKAIAKLLQGALLLIVLTLSHGVSEAQNNRRAGNGTVPAEIKNLVNQFYILKDDYDNRQKLAGILADNFVITSIDLSAKSSTRDKAALTGKNQTAPPQDAMLNKTLKSRARITILPEISSFESQPKGDETDFQLKLAVHYRLKIFDPKKADDFQTTNRFELTGKAVRRGGRWLLLNLQESKVRAANMAEVDDDIKFGMALLTIIADSGALGGPAHDEKSIQKQRQKQKANEQAEKEVKQFFREFDAMFNSGKALSQKDFEKFLAEDFNYNPQNNAAANFLSSFAGPFNLPHEIMIRKKISTRKRNLRAYQNGDTVIANYDMFYYRDVDGQKKYETREVHQSVFVRRAGRLLWLADQTAGGPEGLFNETPRGWIASFGAGFIVNLDLNVKHGGDSSVMIERDAKANPKTGIEFSQSFQAKSFRGKRIQLTAFVKSEDLTGDAEIFLLSNRTMVYGGGDLPLKKGRIQGTNNWMPLTATIDVPADAEFLTITAFLRGDGKIWLDDFSIKPVGPNVPVTDIPKDPAPATPFFHEDLEKLPVVPINADFEDN